MDSNVPPDSQYDPPPPLNPAPPPPPVFTRPPVIAPAPAPAPRPASRGTGWKIFAIILLLLLILSALFNVKHAITSVLGGKGLAGNNGYGPRLQEVTVRESTAATTNKILVLPIEGVISSEAIQGSEYNLVTLVKEELKRAREDDDVKGVILKVDSPGGEVLASDEIANAIRDFQKPKDDKPGKPIVVSMGSLAASGGYYISAPCQYIVANELTITGSIGVIMHGLNYRGLLDKIGVRPEVFKSGKYKDMLSGTKEPEEVTPEEKQMVQDMINETFDKFKSVVRDGRTAAFQANSKSGMNGKQLATDWDSYADGRILSGKEAYRLGFVDDIGDFDVALDRAKQLTKVKNADVVEYQEVFDLSNIFKMFGQSNAKSVRLDLGADIPRLHAGYLYFLSPTYLQ